MLLRIEKRNSLLDGATVGAIVGVIVILAFIAGFVLASWRRN